MKEDIFSETRAKPGKNAEARTTNKATGNQLKPKSHSSWGSQIVRGLTGDKKSKLQSAIAVNKKLFASSEIPKQKSQSTQLQSRVKRSLISDFPCAMNGAQVHPHGFDCQRVRSPASHNLLLELDNLRSLLQESKERESILQAELLAFKENPKLKELEKDRDTKMREVENLIRKVGELESEKRNISEQLLCLSSVLEHQVETCEKDGEISDAENRTSQKNLEIEVLELRRLNKELQLQKRNITLKLSSTEAQLSSLKRVGEGEITAKAEAEALSLRHTNEDLCKQVEGLQMSRLNEVEELAYLRWMNSCLRQELQSSDHQPKTPPSMNVDGMSPKIKNANKDGSCATLRPQRLSSRLNKHTSIVIDDTKGMPSRKMVYRWPKIEEDCPTSECDNILDKEWIEANERRSPDRRHSISGIRECVEVLKVNKRRQSDGFIRPKDLKNVTTRNEKPPLGKDRYQMYDIGSIQSPRLSINRNDLTKSLSLDVEKRALRIPNPPPRPSSVSASIKTGGGSAAAPPPPPPPPPPPLKFSTKSTNVVQRAPEVVELYHSLMKRDSKKEKDSTSGGISDVSDVANMRSSMIGEIENRSSHLLAIKADVETQGEFVRSLIKEVNEAVYRDIEDVVAFVKWLDDELSFLVDERAVLKHFDWPEKKADALREAAFGYRDLKKLEAEATFFEDNPRLPCDVALKKIASLAEKMEHSVYNLLRTRDGLINHYKAFQIPTDWILDAAIISKIKLASVKLAKRYMKRVASELQAIEALDKDPSLDYMLLQGVRFAFRIHQFAGGFDSETMCAFEELRNLALAQKRTSDSC